MLHLIKLCVGCDSVEDLAQWQRKRSLPPEHWTRNHPKRAAEITAGGSLYWVIKGQVRVRQRIMKLERREDEEGVWCAIVLGRRLTRVQPRFHRPFQGWRYLENEDAPPDLVKGQPADELPEKLASELRALGLL
ncbi:MAG TPA: DUF1489 domain-containing protein [Dongiaceae bacterium]|jgi:hypothetical protein|nr:DUF1489 domain-containing protein [Dongiaceae bacterium]